MPNKYTLEERQFQEAKRQIMELCEQAFNEGKEMQKQKFVMDDFEFTKTYKIITNLKTVSEQITELLLKGR